MDYLIAIASSHLRDFRRIKMAAECVVLGGLGVGTDRGRQSAADARHSLIDETVALI